MGIVQHNKGMRAGVCAGGEMSPLAAVGTINETSVY